MSNVTIKIEKKEEFSRFLSLNGFDVENLDNDVYRVCRADELPVFVKIDEQNIYFEVDLGNISEIASQDLYFKLLDLNTEILPVSFGINNTNTEDPRLVLVESRETGDLNDNETLSVFDALELAVDKAEALLNTAL
ncbi:MAG: CesT family type III secretion system chaperone [Opitutaceae bacterium]